MASKLSILKAMINEQLTELLVKTRIDNIFMTDNTTTLAAKLSEIVSAINLREKITDVDSKIENAKTEVKEEINTQIDGLTAADIGATTEDYVDQQISLITETGIPKLNVYQLSIVAETEGQTVFNIELDTFDINTDTVFVQSGRTMLASELDFNVVDNTVVLNEGVPAGRVITIYVFKNVPMGEDGSVSGAVMADGSIPLSKLAEEVLPLTGGTLSANPLGLNGGYGVIEAFNQFLALIARDVQNDNTNKRALLIRTATGIADIKNALILQSIVNSAQTSYNVFGEHNKPSGSYSGNGSATPRTINTGGIGLNFIVWCQTTDSLALLGTRGGVGKVGTTAKTFNGDMAYSNGEGSFVVQTTDALFNQNGATYFYYQL